MEFRILGPLEIRDGEGTIPLAGGRQRALLALLILNANEPVSTDRLVAELWGEHAPETAAKVVRNHISKLRRALAPNERLLVTQGLGYALRLEPGSLDVDRFEQLLERGRRALSGGNAQQAAQLLTDALALWRGPPLADFAYEPFAQSEISRLEERRLVALEERIEADLALGRHADLVGELEALVGEHPLRERLCRQLMLALYRSGRQAEALAAYGAARRRLTHELGLEPGPDLRALEQAILRQDSSLEPEPGHGSTIESEEPPSGVFVGRKRELEELIGGLEKTIAGHGRLFLLVGEPGIGKSRLSEELSRHARARGAQILVGRCWEAGGAPAYWPWVQALRTYIRAHGPSELRAELGAAAGEIAHLLPELRDLFPDLPEPVVQDSESARFRLFEAVATFLKNASRARPLVLALDDLHAADASSLLLLQFVARGLADTRLLILGAYRDADPTVGEQLAETVAELQREPVTRRTSLRGLTEEDIAAYIELTAGSRPQAEIVGTIYEETEGNPLFMGEVVQLLVAEGAMEETRPQLDVPESVRDVIDRRVRRLSAECQKVLVLASVLGREFGLEELGRLADVTPRELLAALDEAMAERIVGEVPDAPGRMRFAHVLIRDVMYEGMTAARRMELHLRAGEALEAVYADKEPHLAELAHHFFFATPAGEADKAIGYTRGAADRAVSLLAYEEAARLYELVLTLIDDAVDRCDLLLALGDAQARAGDMPASKRAFRKAAELADAAGLAEQLGHAALGYGGRLLWDVSRDDGYLVPLLERALAALGEQDSPLHVRLLARLAGGPLRDASFPPQRKAALSQGALEMARRIGDPATLSYALAGYIAAHHSPEGTHQQVELATQLVEMAVEAGDKERALEAHEHRGVALVELGEMPGAKADLEAMAKLAEELRQPSQKWFVAELRAQHALIEGRLDEAERLVADALSLGERAQPWSAVVAHVLQLFLLRRLQGRLDEVEELIRSAAANYRTYSIFQCALPFTLLETGNETESRHLFDLLAQDDLAGLPFDENWLVSMSLLAETARSLDDSRRATILYDKLLPYHDRVAISYSEISTGSVSRYLGLLASTVSQWDAAARYFEEALAMNKRIGARPWLAYTSEDYGRMLLKQRLPGRAERAEELLEDARTTYYELGMNGALARVTS